jgi:hypothetical protein
MFATRGRTFALCVLVASVTTAHAQDLVILNHGKSLRLVGHDEPSRSHGLVRFGKDPALAGAPDPSCPASSSVELGLFTVAANAVVRGEKVALDCARWRRTKSGWRYDDPAAPGGVTAITYGPSGLTVRLAGSATLPAPGPVGYAFTWFQVGTRRFHGRFHVFRKNRADLIASRKTSTLAADGESAFWSIMWGDDASEATAERALATLTRAAKRSKADARVAAFDQAEPLLWDRAARAGDSRVPGFGAAARYSLAIATADEALRQQALADLDYAISINAFFNVFDLMAVTQAEPPSSAAFQQAFSAVSAYISDPSTLECAVTQPEVCTGNGLAPTALPGTFVVFGDLYAKAGDVAGATSWYQFAVATERGWPFEGLGAERLATVDARVAAYLDADPSNDPPIIGAGRQACASCHNRLVDTD